MKKESNTRPAWQLEEFDRPLYSAAHFGFLPIKAPRASDKDLEVAREYALDPAPAKSGDSRHFDDAAERISFLRSYLENGLASLSHPLALAYRRINTSRYPEYALHLIGISSGIAEAMLIRTALSMLHDEGHENLMVDINCIGDKESIATYERELTNYARRLANALSPETKSYIKKDTFNMLRLEVPESEEIRQGAPSSIAFLSSQSRIHFKEVLEAIEAMGIDFRLVPELVGNKHFCSHTIFAVRNLDGEGEPLLALGYRYTRLGRKLGLNKDVHLSTATVFHGAQVPVTKAVKKYTELPRPKFYLVQLGQEAKFKCLSLIETLRRERIAVYHFLGKDKITAQLTMAESLSVPYLIIIGHKEALEDTATIRNVSTRAQDTVPISDLARFLKHITL